jgi:hypothetical protein
LNASHRPEAAWSGAAASRHWRPWKHSTGPRTAKGKERSSRNACRGGHQQNQREAARLLAQLTPRIEAGDVEARAEIVRRILARNVELFFRCVELDESEQEDEGGGLLPA